MRLSDQPARPGRPAQTIEPTHYGGGKIYWSKPKGQYRVYLRFGDRVDKQLKANVDNPEDMRQKFSMFCALIENDTRPVRAS